MQKILAIGECMIELAPAGNQQFSLGYAGDTLNTALYLARFGASVDYFTALGADHFSNSMISQWRAEGVGTNHIVQVQNRTPGLYLIENDDAGERSFHYWRDRSPARELFDLAPQLVNEFGAFDIIYLSGITLSLYSDTARELLFAALKSYRANGGRVAFDINYRPRNWANAEQAKRLFNQMMQVTDIALPSLDDEQLLYGAHSADQCIDRYRAAGVAEIIVKQGVEGSRLYTANVHRTIPVPEKISPKDTTAAGDSFNAGYLAARLMHRCPELSALQGSRCAALVIQYPGAIVPLQAFKDAFPHVE